MARTEGVGHADDVVPLGVAEVLQRQRRHRPRRAAVAVAGEEGLVELPQLLASLHDELLGCQLRRVGDLPRLHLAVVEPVRPRQDSGTNFFFERERARGNFNARRTAVNFRFVLLDNKVSLREKSTLNLPTIMKV